MLGRNRRFRLGLVELGENPADKCVQGFGFDVAGGSTASRSRLEAVIGVVNQIQGSALPQPSDDGLQQVQFRERIAIAADEQHRHLNS